MDAGGAMDVDDAPAARRPGKEPAGASVAATSAGKNEFMPWVRARPMRRSSAQRAARRRARCCARALTHTRALTLAPRAPRTTHAN
jgi:hypothetical protein